MMSMSQFLTDYCLVSAVEDFLLTDTCSLPGLAEVGPEGHLLREVPALHYFTTRKLFRVVDKTVFVSHRPIRETDIHWIHNCRLNLCVPDDLVVVTTNKYQLLMWVRRIISVVEIWRDELPFARKYVCRCISGLIQRSLSLQVIWLGMHFRTDRLCEGGLQVLLDILPQAVADLLSYLAEEHAGQWLNGEQLLEVEQNAFVLPIGCQR